MGSDTPEIIIADDEEHLRTSLRWSFEKEDWRVTAFSNGVEAWSYLRTGPPAHPRLLVLDIMMPAMDGRELCRRIRSVDTQIPIVFLTSRDEEFDRILGLEIGADDYVCKPFSVRELVTRVRVLLRRAYRSDHEIREARNTDLVCGALSLDTEKYRAFFGPQELHLTVSELRILICLAANPGAIRTRDQLQHAAYPDDLYVSERSVDCHIKRLRRKIEAIDPSALPLETVYGLGYRLLP